MIISDRCEIKITRLFGFTYDVYFCISVCEKLFDQNTSKNIGTFARSNREFNWRAGTVIKFLIFLVDADENDGKTENINGYRYARVDNLISYVNVVFFDCAADTMSFYNNGEIDAIYRISPWLENISRNILKNYKKSGEYISTNKKQSRIFVSRNVQIQINNIRGSSRLRFVKHFKFKRDSIMCTLRNFITEYIQRYSINILLFFNNRLLWLVNYFWFRW